MQETKEKDEKVDEQDSSSSSSVAPTPEEEAKQKRKQYLLKLQADYREAKKTGGPTPDGYFECMGEI